MTKVLDDPVLRLISLARDSGRRHIIGLSGVPGSGKTTITTMWAGQVADSLGEGALVVLGLDGFHLSRDELRAMPNPDQAFARRGAPWTFNPTAMAAALRELREGFCRGPVQWPGFEHDVGDPAPAASSVDPHVPVILVEGIYTAQSGPLWSDVTGRFDEQWYLDVPWHDASPRLISRHMRAWGMSEAEATRRAESNDRLNAALVLQGRDRADWLIRPSR